MPAGVALLSPWSDLSPDGNTTNMAMGFDPTLDYERYLRCAAQAYAADLRQLRQQVSADPFHDRDHGPDFE